MINKIIKYYKEIIDVKIFKNKVYYNIGTNLDN